MRILAIVFLCSTFSAFAEKLQFEVPLKNLVNKKVYETPQVYPAPQKDVGEIKAIFYETLPFKGKETRAFAYLGIPKSDKPVPAVVCVHGGGGRAFNEWVKVWNKRGYAAISMSLEGHMPGDEKDKISHEFSGPTRSGRFSDIDQPLDEQWMYHAVSDIMLANSLLRSFPEIDKDRIGVTGISWGGILTSLVSGVDDRFIFAAPVYGAGFLYNSLGHFSTVKGDQKFWDPSRQLEYGNMPILWVNGDTDAHFSVNITSDSYLATKDRSWISIHPGLPHGHHAGWHHKKVPEIYAFADEITGKQTAKLARVTTVENSLNPKFTYTSDNSIESAEIYYTDDFSYTKEKGSKHPKPKAWKKVEAEVNTETKSVSAKLPSNAKVYYLNIIDDKGLISSSELLEVK